MKRIPLFIIYILLLTSCSLFSTLAGEPVTVIPLSKDSAIQASDECIPPLTELAFPAGDSGIQAPNQQQILPSSDWSLISAVSEGSKTSSTGFLDLELIRQRDKYDELWILDKNKGTIFQFRTDTKRWKQNQVNNSLLARSFLFLDNNSIIWAARAYEGKGFPLLSRYNDTNEQFESIIDKDMLLAAQDSSTIVALKVDHKGMFWMILDNKAKNTFAHNYYLYSFDPLTRKAERRSLLGPSYATTLEIAPDNKIFLVDVENSQLVVYSPTSLEMKKIKIPVPLESPSLVDLYLDHAGRLWLNDRGWFDFSIDVNHPQWFTVVRSPIFINYLVPAGMWGWSRPVFTHDNLNALAWYKSARGTGWLSLQSGKWCLITTYQSNVAEDRQHNLWMLIDGSLYKRQIAP